MKNAEETLVSVIVPIHNIEKFLPKCVDSILAQTHKNIEVILVDDGSPDSSGKIADDYARKDKRVRVIHKKNAGVSAARNTGIDKASGSYICFVDGDDLVTTDHVQYLLKLSLETGADISTTDDMAMDIVGTKNQIKHDKIQKYSSEKATIEILLYHIWLASYMKLFKKDFLNQHELRFNTNFRMGEGFIFTTSACQKANYVAVGHRKIYHYRHDNEESVCTTSDVETWKNGIAAINHIRKILKPKTVELKNAWHYASLHTHADALNTIVKSCLSERPPEYKKYIRYLRKNIFHIFKARVSFKEKIRIILMSISPKIVLRIQNRHQANPTPKVALDE